MKIKTRRLGVALAAATATVALSGIGAGGAQAALPGHCLGANITAQGSSLQGAAQDIWTGAVGGGGFNVSASGCNTAPNKPTVAYDRSSSGSCLGGLGANGGAVSTTYPFCGTDDAPNATQIANVTTTTGGQALSIPVAQAAIAIVVSPPTGCTISTLTPAQVESVFRGATTSWTTLNAACSGTINVVTRNDSSGTTYQLKHYLTTVNSGAVSGTSTWADLQSPANNTVWPGAVTKSQSGCASAMALPCSGGAGSGSGGGDEVRTVGAAGSSIGYAALSDARSVYAAQGGVSGTWPNLSWTNIRTGTTTTPNPSTNGVSATKAQSNCPTANNSYSPLPASGATGDWSGTYRANAGSAYPLCTLTWDLALSNYTAATWGGSSANIAQTVKDYLGYAVSAAGQSDALSSSNDYQALPTDVLTTASTGVGEITG
ncbi:MAG TPA: substrate-binding domain-containing protein [Baekduia sp.]|uniref:substrate-binding domain-containing protein n=1 Tax=Baekduia sp. TaxID=2600305 RepID=UPI002D78A613|nr:substrate-binding domain-containing protein [Baekduia sp.]HET6506123.1 substrate-binding domain-containing protein [Baekduia sp.]